MVHFNKRIKAKFYCELIYNFLHSLNKSIKLIIIIHCFHEFNISLSKFSASITVYFASFIPFGISNDKNP